MYSNYKSGNAFSDLSPVSEDCLYLNIWLPMKNVSSSEPYAVMIFFYGGSFDTGSAMFPLYGGASISATNGNTILVAANYRLNAFGFLGSDLLRASDKSTGNFGIQDQRKAMQFIFANAENLGADPTKIMVSL